MIASSPTEARILIVDDQDSNLLFLERVLKQGGYTRYRSLKDSRQVVSVYLDFRPDLVLLDLMMPHLDGVAVIDLLRPLTEGTYLPVVVLTADVADEAKKRALAAGAKDFLVKPLDAIEVLLRIKNLLETRLLYQQLQRHAETELRATQARLEHASTDRERAEAALQESEERYRRLVDVLPAAVFVHAGGELVFCNPAFVRLMGAATAAELLGKSPFDVAHPDDHALVGSRTAAAVEPGQVSPGIEMRVVRLDGRAVPVYSVETPITGYGPSAGLVALSDLTERERSMDLLRSVLASVTDAILTIDDRGTVRSANPATESVFGYSVPAVVGENIRALVSESHRGARDEPVTNESRTGAARATGGGREVEGRRKNGTTFPAELTVTEFRLAGERHFTAVARDISERKRLETQLQQAQKMDAIGRLAGGVAHDFNNLITVISGYTDLMLMELPVGDPRREGLAAILHASERGARLTQQLLAFSRKAIIEPQVLDLNELVAGSAKLFRRLIGEDIILVVVPDPALTRIKADPGQIEQVIMNLAVNARSAMPTGGRLTIETRNVTLEGADPVGRPDLKPGRYVQLTVSDTGHGMTEEVKGKIFEPFFTTKGVGKGTGLGLAVVHGVVQQCGGSIGVATAVGVGTTFNILFPVTAEEDTRPPSGVQKVATRGTETVLLVEDEDAVRTLARIALETQGFKVLEADGGANAIRLVGEYPGAIDLLVTDVVMPGIGGRQLAEAVRTSRPALRVLYMSGYTDDAVLRHGVIEATDAFLQKPFSPLGLARKVRSVLDDAG